MPVGVPRRCWSWIPSGDCGAGGRSARTDSAGHRRLLGLGAHFAKLLAGHGARVALAARRTDWLAAARDKIAATGGTATILTMDVTDENSIRSAYDTAEATIGPIDTVIANAGISVQGTALDTAADAFD